MHRGGREKMHPYNGRRGDNRGKRQSIRIAKKGGKEYRSSVPGEGTGS